MIHLASSTPKHVTDLRQSVLDLFRSKKSSALSPQVTQHVLHRPIPAPEPNPEPNPGPDGTTQANGISHTSAQHISAEDWDELFQAVESRLAHCVDEALNANTDLALRDNMALTKAAVLECVNDMMSLHASLRVERQKWQEHQRHHQYQELEKQQQSSGQVEH